MTKIKTLSNTLETTIAEAAKDLSLLDTVKHILPSASYNAARREILRNMVKRITGQLAQSYKAPSDIIQNYEIKVRD